MSTPNIHLNLSPVVSAINSMKTSLERLGREMASVSSGVSQVDAALDTLKRINQGIQQALGTVNQSIEFQTNMQRNIQLVKSKANLETARKRLKFASKDEVEKRQNYRNQYKEILRSFVEGLVGNIEHFLKLAKREIRPLERLLDRTNSISETIDFMNPEREDSAVVEAALKQFKARENRFESVVYDEFRGTMDQLKSYVGLQREMIRQFDEIKIDLQSVGEKKISDFAVLQIPLWVAEIKRKDTPAVDSSYVVMGPQDLLKQGQTISPAEFFQESHINGNLAGRTLSELELLEIREDYDDAVRGLKARYKEEKKQLKTIKDKTRRREKLKKLRHKLRWKMAKILPPEKFKGIEEYSLTKFVKPTYLHFDHELNNIKFTGTDFTHYSTPGDISAGYEPELLEKMEMDPRYEVIPTYIVNLLRSHPNPGKIGIRRRKYPPEPTEPKPSPHPRPIPVEQVSWMSEPIKPEPIPNLTMESKPIKPKPIEPIYLPPIPKPISETPESESVIRTPSFLGPESGKAPSIDPDPFSENPWEEEDPEEKED